MKFRSGIAFFWKKKRLQPSLPSISICLVWSVAVGCDNLILIFFLVFITTSATPLWIDIKPNWTIHWISWRALPKDGDLIRRSRCLKPFHCYALWDGRQTISGYKCKFAWTIGSPWLGNILWINKNVILYINFFAWIWRSYIW